MSRADRVLIACLALALVIAWPLAAAGAGRSSEKVVVSGPGGTTTTSLRDDDRFTAEGRVSPVEIAIENGTVRVTRSDCPDQICVHTGAIDTPGSVIACVPNGVVVRVEGRGDGRLDAVVR